MPKFSRADVQAIIDEEGVDSLPNKAALLRLHDLLLSKAFDSAGNVRSSAVVDASWLAGLEIRAKMPLCVDLGSCLNVQASERNVEFLRGLAAYPGRRIEEFVPPGW